MSIKQVGFVITGSVLWGREAPIDGLTGWNLQYAIKKLRSAEYEFLYVALPFLRREAVRECVQTRYISEMESEKHNSICFAPSSEDTEAFIKNLELIFPECEELCIVIFGSKLAVDAFQQKIIEFTLSDKKQGIVLLTKIGRPDCDLPMLQQIC